MQFPLKYTRAEAGQTDAWRGPGKASVVGVIIVETRWSVWVLPVKCFQLGCKKKSYKTGYGLGDHTYAGQWTWTGMVTAEQWPHTGSNAVPGSEIVPPLPAAHCATVWPWPLSGPHVSLCARVVHVGELPVLCCHRAHRAALCLSPGAQGQDSSRVHSQENRCPALL